MIVDVKVPEIGESITDGVIVAWLKNNGDPIRAGEVLFELETDKVTMEVPAEIPGRLTIVANEGDVVQVGQVVAKIDTDASDAPEPSPVQAEPALTTPLVSDAAPKAVDVGDGPPINPPAGVEQAAAKLDADRIPPLSPAVRRLVAEHALDPTEVPGSGRDGRITKADVLSHLQARPLAPKPVEAAKTVVATAVQVAQPSSTTPLPTPSPLADLPVRPSETVDTAPRETRVKMSPMRHRIAERLVAAQNNAAILTTFNEVDMSSVMAFRSRHKTKFEDKFDVRLGFMSFFVKAAVDALKTVPYLNAQIDGDEIVYNHFYDIGVAVGTERGLIVPVVRNADRLSFAEIERRIGELARRGRERKLTLQELTGGCFTISNGGIYGSLLSTPILNPPQSGILGLHRIQKRPVVVDDEIVIRPMMFVALSYDHRIVDGEQAVTFLKRIVECIEDPERMLLEV